MMTDATHTPQTALRDQLADLDARLHAASAQLGQMAELESDPIERTRLIGKAQGVGLAMDYLRSYGTTPVATHEIAGGVMWCTAHDGVADECNVGDVCDRSESNDPDDCVLHDLFFDASK